MDEMIRLVVTSKAYTEALKSGITITMSIINGWDGSFSKCFSKSWLLVLFDKNYHRVKYVFDAEEFANMISPEIAVENALAEMRKKIERDGV